MGCADGCHGEIPKERPTLWGSGPVRASALAWVFVLGGLATGLLGGPPILATSLYAASILSGGFYFAREAAEVFW